MNQIKQLVLALVALLIKATNTSRDDEAALAKIQGDFTAQSAQLNALLANDAAAADAQKAKDADQAAKDAQQAADVADLQAQLQAALDAAAAATPPTPDHVETAQASLAS